MQPQPALAWRVARHAHWRPVVVAPTCSGLRARGGAEPLDRAFCTCWHVDMLLPPFRGGTRASRPAGPATGWGLVQRTVGFTLPPRLPTTGSATNKRNARTFLTAHAPPPHLSRCAQKQQPPTGVEAAGRTRRRNRRRACRPLVVG